MEIIVSTDKASPIPLYVQVADQLQQLIEQKKLLSGQKLPSSRQLSESLALSRFTANKAYDELIRRGLIESKRSSGTFVSTNAGKKLSAPTKQSAAACEIHEIRLSSYGMRLMSSPQIESSYLELYPELNYATAAPENLPLKAWKRILSECSKEAEKLSYNSVLPAFGHIELRESLSHFLRLARGVESSPEQICLFSGAQSCLDLFARILTDENDLVLVENPGFVGARRLFASYGANLQPVKVDDQGMKVTDCLNIKPLPKIVYLTPSHHDPTGVALSNERRLRLLAWAKENNVWILEDDFDWEFHYGEKAVRSLQGQDKNDRVVYISSFWKSLFPLLKLGFAVIPQALIPIVEKAKSLIERDFQYLEHECLYRFIKSGQLERHIRKTRILYAEKRELLISCLLEHFGNNVYIHPSASGTQLLIRFDKKLESKTIITAACKTAVPLVSSSDSYVTDQALNEFLIPFAHVDINGIKPGIAAFAETLLNT